ncbi:hypothetical protein RYX36_037371 [Vicia faba]
MWCGVHPLSLTADWECSKVDRKAWERKGLYLWWPVASRAQASHSVDGISEIEDTKEMVMMLLLSLVTGKVNTWWCDDDDRFWLGSQEKEALILEHEDDLYLGGGTGHDQDLTPTPTTAAIPYCPGHSFRCHVANLFIPWIGWL